MISIILCRGEGVPLDSISSDTQSILDGGDLFKKHCTVCHELGKEKIGPDLTSVYDFYEFQWLYKFITNSDSLISIGDAYAIDIFNYYKQTPMPDHNLSEDEVWLILAYIKSESLALDNPLKKMDLDESPKMPNTYWVVIGLLSFTLMIIIVVISKLWRKL